MGDLALYLVTRGLKASDVIDPAKKGQVDFPDSVVALMEGRLGFPHKGFPEDVRRIHCFFLVIASTFFFLGASNAHKLAEDGYCKCPSDSYAILC